MPGEYGTSGSHSHPRIASLEGSMNHMNRSIELPPNKSSIQLILSWHPQYAQGLSIVTELLKRKVMGREVKWEEITSLAYCNSNILLLQFYQKHLPMRIHERTTSLEFTPTVNKS